MDPEEEEEVHECLVRAEGVAVGSHALRDVEAGEVATIPYKKKAEEPAEVSEAVVLRDGQFEGSSRQMMLQVTDGNVVGVGAVVYYQRQVGVVSAQIISAGLPLGR